MANSYRELRRKAHNVRRLLLQADNSVRRFKRQSGLTCINHCSLCCASPDIEASILEFYPLAWSLWQNGRAEEIYDSLISLPASAPCAFFRPPTTESADFWGCSIYPYRGLICRLFGFSARTDKNGDKNLVTCRPIKTAFPDRYRQAEESIHGKLAIPLFSDYASLMAAIDSELACKAYPVNQAIAYAIEKIGFILSYAGPKANSKLYK